MKNNTLSQMVRDDRVVDSVESLLVFGEKVPHPFVSLEEKGAPGKLILEDMPIVHQDDNLIAFGVINQWFFQKMDGKGILEKPIVKGNTHYQVYDPNSITLPHHAQKRMNSVIDAHFPIRQFIYGEEISATPEVTPQRKPHVSKPQIHISGDSLKTMATVATAALTLTVGAAMVVGYAFLLALSGLDPRLIAVVDTGNDESELPWILLDSWGK